MYDREYRITGHGVFKPGDINSVLKELTLVPKNGLKNILQWMMASSQKMRNSDFEICHLKKVW